MGNTLQKRAGTARHDAVAWGYAKGADSMDVDIIQNCEVKDIKNIIIKEEHHFSKNINNE